MRFSGLLTLVAVVGSTSSIVMAQQPTPTRVAGYGRITQVKIGGKVIKNFHSGSANNDAVLAYDNWPATGGFPFYSNGVNGVLDKMSLTPGPGAGGALQVTSLDTFGVAAPAGDPGGTVDIAFTFFNTVDDNAAAGLAVNTGPLGQQVVLTATLGPNPFPTGAVVWLFNPVDITAAGITIPDDDFGVLQKTLQAGTTIPSATYLPNFNGQPFPLVVGSSADNFYFDQNGDGVITVAPTLERFAFGAPASGLFYSNMLIKISGNVVPPTPTCYPNCDGSTAPPILNALDFGCFLTKFAAGDTYANCDGSTAPPTLNALDFGCFLTKFAAGCT